eukprot:gnl/MRDRNA2_/MRDRNA2_94136_c0_seq1.p1 gnl/MRDRNA2_/MRDRNA2_94136_c0~~gnl/MRDRNA2_/MRDRNA2_94136_c0_seq1.p1  ORF type:complete len:539 (+),score=82.98 gnl/MRDRNA2_/MRDRNA2_94136_c0_seq1:129-1745(+)
MASTVDSKRVREFKEPEHVLEPKTKELAQLLRESSYTVFFTGAGVSTSAGVGDYRGPSGLWTQQRIQKLEKKDSHASEKQRDELRKLREEQRKEIRKSKVKVKMVDAQPTLTHMAIATLIRQGLANYVVTTNLDGLHRRSGLKAHSELCCLHGDIYVERCTKCNYEFERNYYVRRAAHMQDHKVGTCTRCGSCTPKAWTGKPKPGSKTGSNTTFRENHLVGVEDRNVGTKDTWINFGENLDDIDWNEADEHCSKADLCVVLGSSMSLRHVTHFPFMAKKTVLVNLQRTPDDEKCHLRIWGTCDDVFMRVCQELRVQVMDPPAWQAKDALPLVRIPLQHRDPAQRLEEFAKQREKVHSHPRSGSVVERPRSAKEYPENHQSLPERPQSARALPACRQSFPRASPSIPRTTPEHRESFLRASTKRSRSMLGQPNSRVQERLCAASASIAEGKQLDMSANGKFLTFKVSNAEYQSTFDGISYRWSKNVADKIPTREAPFAPFGMRVQGRFVGPEWIEVEKQRFLPVFLQSKQVLFPLSTET